MIHLGVTTVDNKNFFFVTYVYAFNDEEGRKWLWKDLQDLIVKGPWIVMGDFNDILAKEERIGNRVRYKTSTDFIDRVANCQLEDVKYSGNFYTWCNKQHGEDRIYSKIDRVLANQAWLRLYPEAETVFVNEGLFDHTPAVLTVYSNVTCGRKPFKYFNMWSTHPDYFKKIEEIWQQHFTGTKIDHLAGCQDRLKCDPLNSVLHGIELEAKNKYTKVHKDYISFLQQKSKLNWARNGDENSTLFHLSIRERRRQNRILSIIDARGNRVDEPVQVIEAFLSFYQELLGSKMLQRKKVLAGVMFQGPTVTESQSELLLKDYSKEEVRKVIFEIPGNKAPGPNGYGSCFYQENWNLIGDEVVEAIFSFLKTGQLFKEINSTVITLVPKTKCRNTVKDYRPIACCNVIYKAATKLICSRLKTVLPSIVAQNQGGFVHG
ncbi:uncharacterized protein LOC133796262 [Humulus lupulus]|uniref:uncharacterized protein LOC133796262 n=1 Tax=Humulus lupulus TaxID=3486 RepID=UPI002B404A05|nr:uncharacterized protein LOC133796262 [Humulus lupulus]